MEGEVLKEEKRKLILYVVNYNIWYPNVMNVTKSTQKENKIDTQTIIKYSKC